MVTKYNQTLHPEAVCACISVSAVVVGQMEDCSWLQDHSSKTAKYTLRFLTLFLAEHNLLI